MHVFSEAWARMFNQFFTGPWLISAWEFSKVRAAWKGFGDKWTPVIPHWCTRMCDWTVSVSGATSCVSWHIVFIRLLALILTWPAEHLGWALDCHVATFSKINIHPFQGFISSASLVPSAWCFCHKFDNSQFLLSSWTRSGLCSVVLLIWTLTSHTHRRGFYKLIQPLGAFRVCFFWSRSEFDCAFT